MRGESTQPPACSLPRRCEKLSDSSLQPLCAHTALEALHLGEATFLTDAAAALLAAHLPRLRSLRLTMCEGLMDGGARALAAMTTLEDLDLSSTGVTGSARAAAASAVLSHDHAATGNLDDCLQNRKGMHGNRF